MCNGPVFLHLPSSSSEVVDYSGKAPPTVLDTLSLPYKPVGAVDALQAELQPGHAPIN